MQYKRNYGKSFMVEGSDNICRNHELYMQQKNTIPFLLPLQVAVEGRQMQYWYEITGKISLDQYLKDHRPGKQFLRSFLLVYGKLETTLQDYLMPMERISLKPEEIFIHNGCEEFWFCYKPYQSGDADRGLVGFLETFLQKMDHEKQQEASLCYQVYDLYISGCTRIQELSGILGKDQAADETIPEVERDSDNRPQTEACASNDDTVMGHLEMGNWFRSMKHAVWQKLGIKEKASLQKLRSPVVVLPGDEEQQPGQYPTVCLSAIQNRIEGKFCYEGQLGENSFFVKDDSLLIGNSQGECQIKLLADTVSRRHARITKENELYYLEDLNSKNGTIHNGTILTYQQKVLLEKNDQIQFADVMFRFI